MITLMNPVLYLIFNAVSFILWSLAIALIFPLRRSRRTAVVVLLLALAFYLALAYVPIFSDLRMLGGLLALGIPAFFLYEGTWYGKALVVAMVMVSGVAEELLAYLILPNGILFTSPPISTQIFIYLLFIFISLLFLSVIVLISRVIRRRNNPGELSRASLLFMLFPISQYAAFSGWFSPVTPDSMTIPPALLAVFALQILADIGLVYALVATSRSGELRAENRLLQSQVRAQQEYYANITEHYRDVRRMRHDIDNHLYTIQALLEDGKADDAARYAGQLQDAQQATRPVLDGCENTVIASFLLHRQKELHEQGIPLTCKAVLPAQTCLPEMDLICALGNLLDNAVEACAGCAEKDITLKVEEHLPYLSISVQNAYPLENSGGKRRRIPELERGVGQTILQQMAEKYDGEFQTLADNGRYTATLILKEPAGRNPSGVLPQ